MNGMHASGVLAPAVLELHDANDVVRMRRIVREQAVEQGLSLVDQTKLVTAASEIARNAVVYGGGGTVSIFRLSEGMRRGVRLLFVDAGPGIPDIDRALQDGYTTGSGLGLGLGGARRLCNEFAIESTPGRGTRVTMARWR